MLKIAKKCPNFALGAWVVSASVGFFRKSPPPPSDFVPVGPRRGRKI